MYIKENGKETKFEKSCLGHESCTVLISADLESGAEAGGGRQGEE